MRNWLILHMKDMASTFVKLVRSPFSFFFSIGVIGITLSLPAGIYVLFENIQSLSRQMTGEPQISLFLQKSANSSDIAQIEKLLKGNSRVKSYQFVSKAEALDKMKKELSGIAEFLELNPLPDAFVVTANDFQSLEKMHGEMKSWPKVEHAQLDAAWVKRLDSFLKLGQVAALILAVLLGAALVFIVFNTIRLQILTQKDEIEVAKLIGATNSFIRRPFLYMGAVQGMAGACAAWGIIAASLHFMNGAIEGFADLYGSRIVLSHMDLRDSLFLLGFSSFLGWLGAWLSVSRHLWKLEA